MTLKQTYTLGSMHVWDRIVGWHLLNCHTPGASIYRVVEGQDKTISFSEHLVPIVLYQQAPHDLVMKIDRL